MGRHAALPSGDDAAAGAGVGARALVPAQGGGHPEFGGAHAHPARRAGESTRPVGPTRNAGPASHRRPLPPQITCIGGCSFYSLALAVQRLCRARRRDREGGVSRGRSSESRSRGRHRSRRRVEQKDNRRVSHERSPAASREYSTSSTSRGSGRYYRDGGRHGGGYPRSGGRVAYHRDGGKVLSDESCSGSEGWV